MTKNKPVSKHILLNETLDEKLETLARASYTNQSQIVRALVAKEYEQYEQQVNRYGSR